MKDDKKPLTGPDRVAEHEADMRRMWTPTGVAERQTSKGKRTLGRAALIHWAKKRKPMEGIVPRRRAE